MRGLVELYLQELRTGMLSMLQYRASLGIWLISGILDPLIYLVVWSTVSRSSGGSVGGFTPGDFAAYYIVLMLVNQTTYTWVMYEFEYRIRRGSFSFALLRPVHPIHTDIADNLSSKAFSVPVMLVAAVLLGVLFHPTFRFQAWAVAAFFPALLLAYLVRFLVEWMLALAAFWTTRVGAVNQVYFIASMFLCGQIAPLSLLPSPVRVAAAILPFRWIVSFPVELLLGRLSVAQALTGFAAQGAWLVAALALLSVAWRGSVKRYAAVGG